MQIPPSADPVEPGRRNHHVLVGERVRVRRQRWQVTDVRSYEGCELVTLLGVGASNAGWVRRIVTPFENVERLDISTAISIVGGRRWWRACRELVVDDGTSGVLRSARSARMELMPHQLEPALAIVRGLGARVLIADEVGLGKTVQAGLVASELQLRGAVARVLVLTPAGLCDQWAAELASRFRLRPVVLGMREIRRRKACLPMGVNPWATEPIVVASIDYVKRPEVLRGVASCSWDLVIVDEAHGAAPGTDRREALAETCGLAPYVLLLTATPHNGDPRAFASLCAVGQRDDTLLVFRRTRADAGGLPERRVHHLHVQPTDAEERMHAELAALTRVVRSEWQDRNRDAWLALVTLHKRALSSAYALEQSVRRRLRRCGTDPGQPLEQLRLPLEDRADELDPTDDAPFIAAVLRDPRQERRLLERLAERAREAAESETKLAALKRLLRRLSEPAVVFTEYRDTLLHLRSALAQDAPIVHGGLARQDRQAAIQRFVNGNAALLFATDAAGEGLNLHQRCRVVVNLELPWNPMRLEQRIGRVDRIGQARRVHAFHLIAAQTNEERLLERLRARVARAQGVVGAPNPLAPVEPVSERSLARLAITGDDREPPIEEAPMADLTPSPEFEVVRLQADAAIEHARLVVARRVGDHLAGNPDPSQPSDGPLVLFSRRRRVRELVGSGALVLHRSVFTDYAGRAIASRLLPVLIALSDRATHDSSRITANRLLHELRTKPVETLDRGFASWVEDTRRIHDAFWRCRLNREHAIARAIAQAVPGGIQPGLFERRAEHAWTADRERRAEALTEIDGRLASAERAMALHLQGPQPSLVVLR